MNPSKTPDIMVEERPRIIALSKEEGQRILNYEPVVELYERDPTFYERFPYVVEWQLTNACPYRCPACWLEAGEPFADEFTTAEALTFVDDLAALGTKRIGFCVGEPLLRPDFFEIAAHAREQGLHVSVYTTGILLDDAAVLRIKELGFSHVGVEVHGATADTHDAFVGVPGAFDKAIAAIRRLVEAEVNVVTFSIFCTINAHEAVETNRLLKSLGTAVRTCHIAAPDGRIRFHPELVLNHEQERQVNAFWVEEFGTADPRELARRRVQKFGGHPGLEQVFAGCPVMRLWCYVAADGSIQVCDYTPLKLGNVRRTNLGTIWRASPQARAIRAKCFSGRCGNCALLTRCGGGCRAVAYHHFGDILAEMPGCDRWTPQTSRSSDEAQR